MLDVPDDRRIEDLLLQWEDAREHGRNLSALDLCPDRPELAPELARRIAALLRLDSTLDGGGTTAGHPPTDLDP
jgi:hypothetical protein